MPKSPTKRGPGLRTASSGAFDATRGRLYSLLSRTETGRLGGLIRGAAPLLGDKSCAAAADHGRLIDPRSSADGRNRAIICALARDPWRMPIPTKISRSVLRAVRLQKPFLIARESFPATVSAIRPQRRLADAAEASVHTVHVLVTERFRGSHAASRTTDRRRSSRWAGCTADDRLVHLDLTFSNWISTRAPRIRCADRCCAHYFARFTRGCQRLYNKKNNADQLRVLY